MLPLYAHDAVGYEIALFLYALIGVGFGFALERAGFGYAPNLAAQFYGTDTRVLKVMFTAIVTACVGLALLGAAGVVDLAELQVPATRLWPQLAGGLLLGIGFIVSGYCPGTAVVATTSGKWDGAATLLGVGLGSIVYGFLYPVIAPFESSGDLGVYRLTDLFGVSEPAMALAILAMAAGAFVVAEKAERYFASRRSLPVPPGRPHTRNRVLGGLAVAVLLAIGLQQLLEPAPSAEVAIESRSARPWTAGMLARRLIENPQSVWIVDLREPAVCEKARIPGALCRPADDPDARIVKTLQPTRTLVVYADRDVPALPDGLSEYRGPIAVLAGGFENFRAMFLEPPDPSKVPADEYRFRAAIHAWLTGAAPAAPPAVQTRVRSAPSGAPRKGGGC